MGARGIRAEGVGLEKKTTSGNMRKKMSSLQALSEGEKHLLCLPGFARKHTYSLA